MAPSLTVMLLCWNHAAFLERCIESLAQQTDRDFGIVFLDNCSSDGSAQIAVDLFTQFQLTANLVCNTEPKGVSTNLNTLLHAASNDYVAVISCDDWYDPTYVAAMKAKIIEQPLASFYYTLGWRNYDDSGAQDPVSPNGLKDGDIRADLLRCEWPVNFMGFTYRRALLIKIGGWDEALAYEDRDMIFRLGIKGPCALVRRKLFHYRHHSKQATANPELIGRGLIQFCEKHAALLGDNGRKWLARYLQVLSAVAIDQGKLPLARAYLARSLRLQPLRITTLRTLAYLVKASLA